MKWELKLWGTHFFHPDRRHNSCATSFVKKLHRVKSHPLAGAEGSCDFCVEIDALVSPREGSYSSWSALVWPFDSKLGVKLQVLCLE